MVDLKNHTWLIINEKYSVRWSFQYLQVVLHRLNLSVWKLFLANKIILNQPPMPCISFTPMNVLLTPGKQEPRKLSVGQETVETILIF